MELLTHRVATGVATLGYGRRAAVWVQGCALACPGCATPESWNPAAGTRLPVAEILTWIGRQAAAPEGLTVSGGEPALQSPGVCALIDGYRSRFRGDVLVYTGLSFERLSIDHPELVAVADVICAGPYVHTLPPQPLRGSSNQTLNLLTPLARRRYHDVDHWPIASQVRAQDGRIVTVGIPDRHALDRVVAGLSHVAT